MITSADTLQRVVAPQCWRLGFESYIFFSDCPIAVSFLSMTALHLQRYHSGAAALPGTALVENRRRLWATRPRTLDLDQATTVVSRLVTTPFRSGIKMKGAPFACVRCGRVTTSTIGSDRLRAVGNICPRRSPPLASGRRLRVARAAAAAEFSGE